MAGEQGNLYIGITDDIRRRVFEHTHDLLPGYSKDHQCHKLIYLEEYHQVEEAISREKQLKGWRREKKRWIIESQNPGWRDLSKDYQ